MKYFSLCIGIFLVLFLMIGVYTAQAQADLTAFDGLWLQDFSRFRNMVYAGADGSSTVPVKGFNETYRNYTCMEVDPSDTSTIKLKTYDRLGRYTNIYGNLYWKSGTNLDFFGYVEFFSEDDSEYEFAYVTAINGKFTSVPGYGTYSYSDQTGFDAWNFLWSAKIPRRIPSYIGSVPCGFVAPEPG